MAVALVTGVSRQRGIAAAVSARLRDDGFTVVTSGWTPYDHEQHPDIAEQVTVDLQFDLGDARAARQLLQATEAQAGPVSALVLAHAHDSGGGVFDITAES